MSVPRMKATAVVFLTIDVTVEGPAPDQANRVQFATRGLQSVQDFVARMVVGASGIDAQAKLVGTPTVSALICTVEP